MPPDNTERDLATGLAQIGDMGIIHCNLTIDEQARQVRMEFCQRESGKNVVTLQLIAHT